jgi:hypothetical protein
MKQPTLTNDASPREALPTTAEHVFYHDSSRSRHAPTHVVNSVENACDQRLGYALGLK